MNSRRRGSTLLELVIVMAILAIASAMIVSFTALVSKQIGQNNARTNLIESTAALKADLGEYFAELDTLGTAFTVSVNEAEKELSFNGNAFSFAEYEGIADLDLSVYGENLLKCTLIGKKNVGKTTFLLTSRCGATFTLDAGGAVE